MAEMNMVKIITDGDYINKQEIETMFNIGTRTGFKAMFGTNKGIEMDDLDTEVTVTDDGKIKIRSTVEITMDYIEFIKQFELES